MMKNIALIYMGGTFGCVGDPLAPMSADLFIPKLEQILAEQYFVECHHAPAIKDSSACTATDWLQLVQFIQQLQSQQIQHFVIIHGTDTLSYASAVLAHFIGNSAHVVLTGSQYPLLNAQGNEQREFSDALDNLKFALDSVSESNAGVYLAFHHQLLHAQTALKQHTTELNAFSGLDANIAIQTSQACYQIEAEDIAKAAEFSCMSIMMQPVDLTQQLNNLNNLLARPPHFLFLQGFGTGNLAVNDAMIAFIDQLYEQGCISVLTTQVPFGATDQRYAIAEWVNHCKILLNESYGHADLYAKALKMYLQYDTVEQWHRHWYDQ
ncbi:asparaginase domain-containing protein [Acinetobacter sp. YH12105]|uniref:asparaginase domain-containing protein n=1 Tax=Acinetobacter sp. YH12105 TaxID=2601093 RepID=UPI0015D2FFF5|nr:asparaginase domain-containing protein [Acinetobacter sp. YH12105]